MAVTLGRAGSRLQSHRGGDPVIVGRTAVDTPRDGPCRLSCRFQKALLSSTDLSSVRVADSAGPGGTLPAATRFRGMVNACGVATPRTYRRGHVLFTAAAGGPILLSLASFPCGRWVPKRASAPATMVATRARNYDEVDTSKPPDVMSGDNVLYTPRGSTPKARPRRRPANRGAASKDAPNLARTAPPNLGRGPRRKEAVHDAPSLSSGDQRNEGSWVAAPVLLVVAVCVVLVIIALFMWRPGLSWHGAGSCADRFDTAALDGTVLGRQASLLGLDLARQQGRKSTAQDAFTLLVSGRADAVAQAEEALKGGLRHCSAECVLTLEGTAFAEGDPDELAARGQLALVQLLQRCPTAAVFVRDVDRAHRAVLTGPLLTLTSESGSFMHMGKTVPATGSLVVLTMGGEDAPQTEREAKARLMKAAQGAPEGKQRALTRRVDYFIYAA